MKNKIKLQKVYKQEANQALIISNPNKKLLEFLKKQKGKIK